MADGSAGGLDPAGFEIGGESGVARRRRIISIGCTVIAVCAAGVSVAAAVSSRHSSPPSNVYLSLTLPTTATGTPTPGAATSSPDTASAAVPTSPVNPPPSAPAPAPSTIVVTTANPVGPGGPQPPIRPPSARTSATHTQPPPSTSAAPPPSTSAAPPPSPSPTPVAIAGELTCTSGHSIEGVWVSALVGSGYAPWQGTGANTAHYWYKLPQNESWSLHVGCGGTQQYWAVAAYSDVVTGTQVSFTCYDVAGQPNYGTCSRQ